MSHRVATSLSDDTWGRFDMLREREGVTEAEMLRRIVERATAAFEAEIAGARQMGLAHPALMVPIGPEVVVPEPADSGDDRRMDCTCIGGPHGGYTCPRCRA